MLLREALKRVSITPLDESARVALISSFEPLYVAVYLQALLACRFPDAAPRVIHWGYDRLEEALVQTSSDQRGVPALFFLSWQDIHPGLSWRSRGEFSRLSPLEIGEFSQRLERRLMEWLKSRELAESYIVLPSRDELPLVDPCHPWAYGSLHLKALSCLMALAEGLASGGARILAVSLGRLDYRQWLHSGCPLTLEAAEEVARCFIQVAYPPAGRVKAVVTDLDGTLWKGAVGEEGFEGIRCRPESEGYPYYVFQKFLFKLQKEGILLAFCSKNSPEAVRIFDAVDMPLKRSDFLADRCNWESKSANLKAISQELNIGLSEMVMIDDNPAEIAEIQQAIPQIRIFRTPQTGEGWLQMFQDLQAACGTWGVSREDRIRSDVGAQRRRGRMAAPVPTVSAKKFSEGDLSYLKRLHLTVTIEQNAFEHPRSLELINKTNQFHSDGERISSQEWGAWSAQPGSFCWSARLKDDVGDFGVVGVVTGQGEGLTGLRVKAFVLSCRAFGRGVEAVLLGQLMDLGPWEWVSGLLKDTGRNEPFRRFLTQLGAEALPQGWRISRKAVEEAAQAVLRQTQMRVFAESGESRPTQMIQAS